MIAVGAVRVTWPRRARGWAIIFEGFIYSLIHQLWGGVPGREAGDGEIETG